VLFSAPASERRLLPHDGQPTQAPRRGGRRRKPQAVGDYEHGAERHPPRAGDQRVEEAEGPPAEKNGGRPFCSRTPRTDCPLMMRRVRRDSTMASGDGEQVAAEPGSGRTPSIAGVGCRLPMARPRSAQASAAGVVDPRRRPSRPPGPPAGGRRMASAFPAGEHSGDPPHRCRRRRATARAGRARCRRSAAPAAGPCRAAA